MFESHGVIHRLNRSNCWEYKNLPNVIVKDIVLCLKFPPVSDELKDNALEDEEELKDELGEMGSNISRHSGKGLSGRRTQSSGNLCNGKLVSNVGKLLVPCTKQGDDLTSPNRLVNRYAVYV